MTKSQNTKSEQLTEQWRKGELPEGHYYIKTRSETNIDEYIQWYKDHGIPSEKSFAYFNVQQVLAPVPSYEEWKASYNCMLENEVLRLKNAQLKERVSKLEKMQYSYTPEEWNTMLRTVNRTKELLKECKDLFVLEKGFMVKCIREETLSDIIAKIDEALQ